MKNITHVFFDLDHTLWDYETNSLAALKELHGHFGIDRYASQERFIKAYKKVNENLWRKFNAGKIGREYIVEHRFPMVMDNLAINPAAQPEELHEFFISNCSNRDGVFPGTHEVLSYLKQKYPLTIITNGFPEAQYPKMRASNLEQYFDQVIISIEVGLRKPDKAIYQLAMKRVGAAAQGSVMIGDNPKTDIRGAEGAGMKAIFFNPTGARKSVTEYQIESLHELISIL